MRLELPMAAVARRKALLSSKAASSPIRNAFDRSSSGVASTGPSLGMTPALLIKVARLKLPSG